MLVFACFVFNFAKAQEQAWIRVNQLGYTPAGIKVAVFGVKEKHAYTRFELIYVKTQKNVFSNVTGRIITSINRNLIGITLLNEDPYGNRIKS